MSRKEYCEKILIFLNEQKSKLLKQIEELDLQISLFDDVLSFGSFLVEEKEEKEDIKGV